MVCILPWVSIVDLIHPDRVNYDCVLMVDILTLWDMVEVMVRDLVVRWVSD